jgi:hypothetical protein
VIDLGKMTSMNINFDLFELRDLSLCYSDNEIVALGYDLIESNKFDSWVVLGISEINFSSIVKEFSKDWDSCVGLECINLLLSGNFISNWFRTLTSDDNRNSVRHCSMHIEFSVGINPY